LSSSIAGIEEGYNPEERHGEYGHDKNVPTKATRPLHSRLPLFAGFSLKAFRVLLSPARGDVFSNAAMMAPDGLRRG
jgi:hypothetical protein